MTPVDRSVAEGTSFGLPTYAGLADSFGGRIDTYFSGQWRTERLPSAPVSDLVLYTANEVADLLRLHHQVVQRKLQAGEIPGYRIGREWRVERTQLLAWLEQHSNQQPAPA